jgi:uroporphyrinogen-III synthase
LAGNAADIRLAYIIGMDQPERPSLAGFRVAVAATRRGAELCTVSAAGHRIEIHGSRVTVDGTVQSMSAAPLAILRALALRPGSVVARSELLRALPGSAADPHAVDTAVLRLRKALGDRNIVVTVIKRGYRLAIDESSGAA